MGHQRGRRFARVRVAYCDGRRLRRVFLGAAEHVCRHRAELNRLNVFPVPDGDTGTNLAVTLGGMAEAVRREGVRALGAVATRLAESGLLAARGNSGMLFSRYVSGFAEAVAPLERAGVAEIAAALRHAARQVYRAVERPVEGTFLTVAREVGEHADALARRSGDLVEFLQALCARARESLARTTELLPALREAGVVDAGAQGLVHFFEGAVRTVVEGAPEPAAAPPAPEPDPEPESAVARFALAGHTARYCSEFLVRGDALPEEAAFAEALRGRGTSLVVHRTRTLAKVHIHTDRPGDVRAALARWGRVEPVKVEDMHAQHAALARRAVAVVTDSTCDLPAEWTLAHGVQVIPMTVFFGEEAYLDQVEIGYEEFLRRLTAPGAPAPTTSQPAPAQFREAFARALEHADRALALLVSGALSGTYASACAVAREFGGRVRCFDSRSASLGLGFLVVRAVEAIEAGCSWEELEAELLRARAETTGLVVLDTLDYALRSGRVSAARALLANWLDVKPILGFDPEGRVVPVARARGAPSARRRVEARVARLVPSDGDGVRLGIVHAGVPEVEAALASRWRARWPRAEIWTRPVTGVLAAHAGPGAWGVFVQGGSRPGTNPAARPFKR